jgi:glycosyltransferase involved in cell wall biosynthesis
MLCPTLRELPSSPRGKIGWPWTEESAHFPKLMPDGSEWPCISIVTPSYNQGQFIEETIRSVLLQGYPNLEYIIIDGGSNDQSVEIIRKYEKYLAYWVSETDRGQSHALNKGLEWVTGEIFTFINSDDFLAPDALYRVATYFTNSPSCWVLKGGHVEIDQNGLSREFPFFPSITWEDLALGKHLPQPGTFWKTNAFLKTGRFREDLHYVFDKEFFIRLLQNYFLETITGTFAYIRLHDKAKTQMQECSRDVSHETHKELLKLLPKLRLNPLARLLTYRSFKLNMLKATIPEFGVNLVKKLSLLTQFPILFTSPSYLKNLFTKD